MINNLNDVIQNITDLIESKKEKLRILYETQSILKDEIIELEQVKVKLGSNEIHLVTDNSKPVEDKTIISRVEIIRPRTRDIIEYISSVGRASMNDLKKHFNCKSGDLSVMHYLLTQRKLLRNGLTDNGKDMFSINTSLMTGTE